MRGLISEYKACCYFAQQGYRPLLHRHKIAGVEVDWVSSKDGEYQLWEVKSVLKLGDFSLRGFHRKQIQRLQRALEIWSLRKGPSRLFLVEVTPGQQHQVLPLDFLL